MFNSYVSHYQRVSLIAINPIELVTDFYNLDSFGRYPLENVLHNYGQSPFLAG